MEIVRNVLMVLRMRFIGQILGFSFSFSFFCSRNKIPKQKQNSLPLFPLPGFFSWFFPFRQTQFAERARISRILAENSLKFSFPR